MGSRIGCEEERLGLGIGIDCKLSCDVLGTTEEEGMRPGLTAKQLSWSCGWKMELIRPSSSLWHHQGCPGNLLIVEPAKIKWWNLRCSRPTKLKELTPKVTPTIWVGQILILSELGMRTIWLWAMLLKVTWIYQGSRRLFPWIATLGTFNRECLYYHYYCCHFSNQGSWHVLCLRSKNRFVFIHDSPGVEFGWCFGEDWL